jgi:hypothetical protein
MFIFVLAQIFSLYTESNEDSGITTRSSTLLISKLAIGHDIVGNSPTTVTTQLPISFEDVSQKVLSIKFLYALSFLPEHQPTTAALISLI